MHGDATPEEKLLKLIKKNDQPANTPIPVSADNPSPVPHTQVQIKRKPGVPIPWVKRLTTLGFGFVIFLVSILGYQLIIGEPVLPLPIRKNITTAPFELPRIIMDSKNSFEYYENIYNKRNYFKDMGTPPPVNAPTSKATTLGDITKTLFLSGIISGDSPQAIVEDRSNGQMYYVSSGDYIGPVQIIEVSDDHVLLKYGDEEGQLTL